MTGAPQPAPRPFTPADLARIAEAVRESERGVSGEIVPVLAAASDHYEEAFWRTGAVFVAAGLFVELALQRTLGWTGRLPSDPHHIGPFLLGLLGAALAFHPAVRRLAAGRSLLEHRVGEAAQEAFLREQVFATRDRTGILLYVSLLERRVVVRADAGIAARVPQESWDGVVARIVEGMRRGTPAEGLAAAIRMCGELLRASGFTARPDDVNELSDALRLGPSS